MQKESFAALLNEVLEVVGARALDDDLREHLQASAPPDGALFQRIEDACHAAIEAGWMCKHEAGGIRYGRVLRAQDFHGYSVDVVQMNDVAGPRHAHPRGEIDMIMPLAGAAEFDGWPRGWCVYPPGSEHSPTVSGGAALVLYLLPGGEIQFT